VGPLTAIVQALQSSAHTLIACHVNPDGDCLGSGLALAAALRRLGRRVTVGSSDGVPATLRFLPGADAVVTAPPAAAADVAVTMECSTIDRAGAFEASVAAARTIVAIDHHVERPTYAHHVDWDPTAAAVGEQVLAVIDALGVAVDEEIAVNLLTAVITDTGVFRYANTTPRALRTAARLVDAGASVERVVQAVYESQPLAAVRLLGRALAAVRVDAGGAVASTVLTPALFADIGASSEDASGIASMLRAIDGVSVGIMFEERAEGVRVSIRSRWGVRADQIARALGGGGHAAAAGAQTSRSLEDAMRMTLEAAAAEVIRAPHRR